MIHPTCGHNPLRCDPVKPWADQPADRCTRCYVFATQTPERRAAQEKRYATRPAVCRFRGDKPVKPPAGVNRVSMKTWYECEHNLQPLGAVVSPCEGCRPTCPGYLPTETT